MYWTPCAAGLRSLWDLVNAETWQKALLSNKDAENLKKKIKMLQITTSNYSLSNACLGAHKRHYFKNFNATTVKLSSVALSFFFDFF